jgi:3'-phosphoadenosine 5'-phosphosulfate sulfotransferase (PAPS reductase)/FAD synthetase
MKPKDQKNTITPETKKHLKSGSDLIVSYSGGKDSTAVCLRLFELGYTKNDFKRVFFDTGWESQKTYEYIDQIQETIGEVHRIKRTIDISNLSNLAKEQIADLERDLGYESPMIRLAYKKSTWPSSLQKWCTKELKLEAFKEYINEADNDLISIIGVRREESTKRSNVLEWEWNEGFNLWTWRPLFLWKEKDVINIHHRFGIIPNSLYLSGSSRIGCWPCIYSRKSEIKILPADRVDFIEKCEKYLGEYLHTVTKNEKLKLLLLEAKNHSGFLHRPFFKMRGGNKPRGIRELQEWGMTSHGGKQLMLFDTNEPSCMKWGLCSFTR